MSQVATIPRRSLVDSMASRYDMEPRAFVDAIKATVVKGAVSNEQFAAFLMVAKEYDLNPLLKEIYAFPSNGGIQPIVSIDGWMKLINSHPQFDGMEFTDMPGGDGKLSAVECRMYRKDRARPICVIEYMSECFRQTPTWKQWPARMLRHKAAIQAARYAFGFSNIMEPDEFERMRDVTPRHTETIVADPLSDDPISRNVIEDAEIDAQEPASERDDAPPANDAGEDDRPPQASREAEEHPEASEQTTAPDIDGATRNLLAEAASKFLALASDETMEPQDRRAQLGATVADWKREIQPDFHPRLKRVLDRADAVAQGKLSVQAAVKLLAAEIGVKEGDVEPAGAR